jgi:hypothetical protein
MFYKSGAKMTEMKEDAIKINYHLRGEQWREN